MIWERGREELKKHRESSEKRGEERVKKKKPRSERMIKTEKKSECAV